MTKQEIKSWLRLATSKPSIMIAYTLYTHETKEVREVLMNAYIEYYQNYLLEHVNSIDFSKPQMFVPIIDNGIVININNYDNMSTLRIKAYLLKQPSPFYVFKVLFDYHTLTMTTMIELGMKDVLPEVSFSIFLEHLCKKYN